MDNQNINEKVAAIFRKVLKGYSFPSSNDEDFSNRINSIQFVTLLIEIENEFDIEIEDKDFNMEMLSSVNRITDLVISYKEKY